MGFTGPRCRFPSIGSSSSVLFCGQSAWLPLVSCLAPVTGHPSPWDRSHHPSPLKSTARAFLRMGWPHQLSIQRARCYRFRKLLLLKDGARGGWNEAPPCVPFCVARGETVAASADSPELRGPSPCFLQCWSLLPPCRLQNCPACLVLFSLNPAKRLDRCVWIRIYTVGTLQSGHTIHLL